MTIIINIDNKKLNSYVYIYIFYINIAHKTHEEIINMNDYNGFYK